MLSASFAHSGFCILVLRKGESDHLADAETAEKHLFFGASVSAVKDF
jgi:hypothetical protein